MSSTSFALCWLGAMGTVVAIYYLTATGRLYCAIFYLGHIWATLKDEVRRPIKVIKEALSRKGMELDEHEEKLS